MAIVISLFSLFLPFMYGQDHGFRYIRNYSPKDYNSHPQNWSVVQDKDGLIYVGNNGSLLQFDGVSWRSIDIPNYSVRSLACAETNIIYVGGNNQLGFLTPDKTGSLAYQSLLEYIPTSKRDFSNVWKTHCLKDCIYFRSSRFLFLWHPGTRTMKILETPFQFNASFKCGGNYFVHQRDLGLMEIIENTLHLTPNGDALKGIKIYCMVEFKPGTYLLGSCEKGFYLYDYRSASLTPFPTQADVYLQKNELYDGIPLSHSPGTFALATTLGGLVIIDSNGHLIDIFSKTNGLLDNNVRFLHEDNQGNLWLGLNDGISRIEYAPTPISFYDQRSGLSGILLSIVRHSGTNDLYVGTSTGLFVLEQSQTTLLEPHFIPVNGITDSCFSLLDSGDSILAATTNGLFQLDTPSRRVTPLSQLSAYVLERSPINPNRLWVGTRDGLQSFYLTNGTRSGPWKLEHAFENIHMHVRSIVETKQGTLWLGISGKGVMRLDFPISGTITNPNITTYDEHHGLPTQEVCVFNVFNRVRFGTNNGLYYFNEQNLAFLPDPLLGSSFADGSRNIFRLVEDSHRHLWFHSKNMNFHAVPQPDGSFGIDSRPFLRIPPSQVNAIYPDGFLIWFVANNSLIRYDTRIKAPAPSPFHAFIRHVRSEEQIIFNGSGPNRFFPVLPFEKRNLRFTFAAPFFQEETQTQYSYYLEGYEKEWSPWSSETQKDYTNLDAGNYRFRVKAKNIHGDFSSEAVLQFKVLSPWYRTWWAYSASVLAVFLLLFLVVRWRSAKLVREKERLEAIVKNRTRQLEMQAQQLAGQATQLQEMDRIKSRFFANISHEFRTPLTLIIGPLEQSGQDAGTAKGSALEEFRDMMLKNARRLLTLINQLLDLAKFDAGKMKLQTVRQDIVPFLRNILASFEWLATQKKVLLQMQTEEREIWLHFDADQMQKVFYNLLANALNYTPAAGRITLGLRLINGALGNVEITVADTGVGIPQEQLNRIFDYLFQVARNEAQLARVSGGTGIGLALTREIIQLHGGSIIVSSSEGQDSGTVFTITLPLANQAFSAQQDRADTLPSEEAKEPLLIPLSWQAEAAISQDEGILNSDTANNSADLEEQEAEEAEVDLQQRVLVVEDNSDLRQFLRRSLAPDYLVLEAGDGKEGIEVARKQHPDLIISDVMMPQVDGFELCRVLKKDVVTSHIPIILLTARTNEENVLQGLQCGADDYITKPFNTKIVIVRVKNLLDLRSVYQQKYQREMRLQPAEIPVSSVDQAFLTDLQKVMEANLEDPEFSINRLAELLYLSRATLNRKIRALTGESANRYIQIYRLKRAAQLLKKNFGTITQVAFAVGFSSSPYFTKCFKEVFHLSPQSYLAAESNDPSEVADD